MIYACMFLVQGGVLDLSNTNTTALERRFEIPSLMGYLTNFVKSKRLNLKNHISLFRKESKVTV